MVKLSAALSGVRVYHKNNKNDALLPDCGPNTLKVMFTEILETYKKTPENPLNITELMSVLRLKGIIVRRGLFGITLDMLSRLNVLTIENTWRETLIKPNYTKVDVTIDDDGRTVVKLN